MSSFIGIDLGTSNSAIAVAKESGEPEILPVTQLLTASGVGEKPLLPSTLFVPPESEPAASRPRLPWQRKDRDWVLGAFARERGAQLPDRLIHSAKSWLCHPHVDRRSALLPWQSASVDRKWSPVEVSREILSHLVEAARQALSGEKLDPSQVVVTVPASFDETARSLTLEAAAAAGLGEVTLLEEPQAAFYAWLEHSAADWRKAVRAGDLVLVCDVGGGTADFSLIAVGGNDGDLALERVVVGDHLLLGGDNIDLALAHGVSEKLASEGRQLDEWQFLALVQAVRSAKEAMLGDESLEVTQLAIPTRGSRMLASTISTSITRVEMLATVLEGFFPKVGPQDMPAMRRAGGLREAGLPYAADPAVTRHLARFLRRAQENLESSQHPGLAQWMRQGSLVPAAVLFNGGVFHSPLLRRRVLDVLGSWAGAPVRELEGGRPDHAVALGAAAYARLRKTGKGLRIKAGTARSYYIGMESSALAVPGRRPPVKALCVAPQGMEEGTETRIDGQTFFLYTGEESEFRFFQSEVRSGDQPGAILPDATALEESASLRVHIPPPPGHQPGEEVPVQAETRITELGNMEFFLVHQPTRERWKLEFNVRVE